MADDYAWFNDCHRYRPAFCITFIAGLTPEDVLRRLSLTEDPQRAQPWTVEIGDADGGSIMGEPGGTVGTMVDVLRDLSWRTSVASVTRNVNYQARFVHARDGEIISVVDPMWPDWTTSREPETLRADLEDLGMIVDISPDDADDDGFFAQNLEAALALAERVTGVRLQADHLRGHRLPHRASVAHLYELDPFPELA